MPFRLQLDPAQTVHEFAELSGRLVRGTELLSSVKDEDVAVGTAPKKEVFREDKTVLYHYDAVAATTVATPVLVVYGLVGRYTMADLQEDRSLIRNLLAQGIDLYAVDWGNPTRADRWLTLDDYIEGYLASCVEHICKAHGVERINLLGICEGGVFTACYAALHPDRIKSLILTITPIDFHADRGGRADHGFINLWTRSLGKEDVDRLIEANGNLPGELMSFVFSSMTPLASLTKYNLGMLDVMDDEKKLMNFLRMEKWLQDRPHHPGEAAKQWLKDLYQDNKLVKNEFVLAGRKVELPNLTMPVLNVYAENDHIIPPGTSRALAELVGTDDYTEIGLPGGHVGVFVSGKSQGVLGKGITDWLRERS
ncbi:MAG TPA: class III poly(R)-hydroxyalkanoic acid synthase subunit PhaC [Casimicrobiaceae bacterium]|nr:class III poly(R)-hydroxyalkanoic acid synthase subunit PhaC [Casimicrobiaceae bacterium]